MKSADNLPRGLRNNNPGNIRHNPDIPWLGTVPEEEKKDKTFEEFKSMAYGYRALLKLLRNYRKLHGMQTIKDIIHRYAPPVENNTDGYVQRVCKEMGVAPDYIPDIDDRETMCSLAAAISEVENGVPAYIPDVEHGWQLLNL